MSHLHPSAIVATQLPHRHDFTLKCTVFLLLLHNIQGKPFVPVRFFNYYPLSLICSHELPLEDDHYISFCQFSRKENLNGHFSLRASLWNTETVERNTVSALACARLLLSLWQSRNICLGSASTYYTQRAQEMSSGCSFISSEKVNYGQFSPFFVWLIREPFCPGEKQPMRREDKGLAQPLAVNGSGRRITTQHVPCCFPVSLTYLLWHPHHYPGLVLTRWGAVS